MKIICNLCMHVHVCWVACACACMCLCVLRAIRNYSFASCCSMKQINSFCACVHDNGRICMYVCLFACMHAYACMREMWGAFEKFASLCPLSRQEKCYESLPVANCLQSRFPGLADCALYAFFFVVCAERPIRSNFRGCLDQAHLAFQPSWPHRFRPRSWPQRYLALRKRWE